jgi:hypothetical protein
MKQLRLLVSLATVPNAANWGQSSNRAHLMEIEFPIEFIVLGIPVSFQADRPAAKLEWKERVKDASRSAIPRPHLVSKDRMAITMYYFPAQR